MRARWRRDLDRAAIATLYVVNAQQADDIRFYLGRHRCSKGGQQFTAAALRQLLIDLDDADKLARGGSERMDRTLSWWRRSHLTLLADQGDTYARMILASEFGAPELPK